MLRRIVAACFLLTFLVLPNIALAQEFSANVVSQKSDNAGMKKVYAAKDKVRFELQGANPQMGPSAILFDDAKHTYTVILTERRMYMDAPVTVVRPILSHFWRVGNPNDAARNGRKPRKKPGPTRTGAVARRSAATR